MIFSIVMYIFAIQGTRGNIFSIWMQLYQCWCEASKNLRPHPEILWESVTLSSMVFFHDAITRRALKDLEYIQ